MAIKLNGSDVSIPLCSRVYLNDELIWQVDLPDDYERVVGYTPAEGTPTAIEQLTPTN